MKVAVLMPVFNHERFLEETIFSVLNQTYEDIHLYISDDHSTDQSWRIILEFKNKYSNRITCIRNKFNIGSIKNTNNLLGLICDEKKEDILICTAGDDLMEDKKIELQVNVFKKQAVDIVFHDYKVMNWHDREIIGRKRHQKQGICNHQSILDNSLPTITVALRIDKIGNLRYFDNKSSNDLSFFYQYIIKNKSNAYYIPQELIYYGRHEENLNVSDFDNRKDIMKDILLSIDNLLCSLIIGLKYLNIIQLRYSLSILNNIIGKILNK